MHSHVFVGIKSGSKLLQTEHSTIEFFVFSSAGEVVKGFVRDVDDMAFDEGRAFPGAVFGMFETAFPLQHSPAFKIVLGKLPKDQSEPHLTAAKGAKASRAFDPALVAAINALASRRIEFGVFYMEHPDAFVINVDVLQVVEALQHKVGGVIEQAGSGMVTGVLQERLVGNAVVQVLSGVDLIAKVDTLF